MGQRARSLTAALTATSHRCLSPNVSWIVVTATQIEQRTARTASLSRLSQLASPSTSWIVVTASLSCFCCAGVRHESFRGSDSAGAGVAVEVWDVDVDGKWGYRNPWSVDVYDLMGRETVLWGGWGLGVGMCPARAVFAIRPYHTIGANNRAFPPSAQRPPHNDVSSIHPSIFDLWPCIPTEQNADILVRWTKK